MGKKTTLTLDDFTTFFDLLPKRTDSDRSWTEDFTARRRKAEDDARPFRQTEAEKKDEARALKDALTALKKARPLDETKVAETEAALDAATRAARDAAKKAEAIESAVYDLKAVNPHRKAEVDRRTPIELLDVIEAKGAEVVQALAELRRLTIV